MRLCFTFSIALAALSLAASAAMAAPVDPGMLDMCAVETNGYPGALYDRDWFDALPAKRAAGTIECVDQSMHRLGTADGRAYAMWQAQFLETAPESAPRTHTVMQIGEYDADGKLTIVHGFGTDEDVSAMRARLVQSDGKNFIAITDPDEGLYLRDANGFRRLDTDTELYAIAPDVVTAALPEGYVAPEPIDMAETKAYRATFDADDLALDLPVAVASEVFPRDHADPEHDRPLFLRFPLQLNEAGRLMTGTPELFEPEGPASANIGETPAAFSVPKQTKACSLTAYLEDDDPAGVSVRATPGSKAPVIATLPGGHPDSEEGWAFGAKVDVIGSYDGWFLIENAEHPAELYGDEEATDRLGAGGEKVRHAYRGRGWVHGSRLGTEIQYGESLRAGPDPASKAVFDLKLTGDTPVSIDTFKSCEGDALEVDVTRQDGVKGSGWIGGDTGEHSNAQLCSNQATTCS